METVKQLVSGSNSLIASGQWNWKRDEQNGTVAAAEDAGQLEFALVLAEDHPTDSRNLIRAAEKHQESESDFTFGAAQAALRWMSRGHGYEITNADIFQAVRLARDAGRSSGMDSQTLREKLSASVGEQNPVSAMVHQWIDTTLS